MKPETERYLDKARQGLNEAHAVAGIELAEAAGRAVYLAMFYAAQALIFGSRDALSGKPRLFLLLTAHR